MTEIANLQKASRLAARVQMRDVRLVRMSSETTQLPHPGTPLTYDQVLDPAIEINETQGLLVIEINYKLAISQEVEDTRTEISEITGTYAALYEMQLRADDEPFSQDEVIAFGQTTGALALHPYWREFVYSTTGRMALPPLTLGVFQVEMAMGD